MDKVINGVDVSECKKYHNGWCLLSETSYGNVTEFCAEHTDCYYKQLKRKEQENEELKKQYNCYACDSCSGKEDYINMKRHTENAIKTVHKYRQTLQEIRDMIAKPYCCKPQDVIDKINEVIGAE